MLDSFFILCFDALPAGCGRLPYLPSIREADRSVCTAMPRCARRPRFRRSGRYVSAADRRRLTQRAPSTVGRGEPHDRAHAPEAK